MPKTTKRPQPFDDKALKVKHTITISIGEAKDPQTGEVKPATQIKINDDIPFSLEVVDDALETLGVWAGEIFVRSCERAVKDPTSPVDGSSVEELISEKALTFWSQQASIYVKAFADEIKELYPGIDLLTPEAFTNALKSQ